MQGHTFKPDINKSRKARKMIEQYRGNRKEMLKDTQKIHHEEEDLRMMAKKTRNKDIYNCPKNMSGSVDIRLNSTWDHLHNLKQVFQKEREDKVLKSQ